MNDEDFFSHITRAEFEEASAPLLERIRGTVQRALEQSNRSLVFAKLMRCINYILGSNRWGSSRWWRKSNSDGETGAPTGVIIIYKISYNLHCVGDAT